MTVERVAEELQRILPVINKTGKPILIIWDSVAQTAAEKEIERGVGNQQPGLTKLLYMVTCIENLSLSWEISRKVLTTFVV